MIRIGLAVAAGYFGGPAALNFANGKGKFIAANPDALKTNNLIAKVAVGGLVYLAMRVTGIP